VVGQEEERRYNEAREAALAREDDRGLADADSESAAAALSWEMVRVSGSSRSLKAIMSSGAL
jgi:hypothetical protein